MASEAPKPSSNLDSESEQSTTPAPIAPAPDISEDKPQDAELPEPAFGWTLYAEQLNGRFAMIGFVVLLAIEILTGKSFLAWLGLR